MWCYSCRDGLAEPPKQPKKRAGPSCDPEIERSPVTSQSTRPMNTKSRPDSTMQDLERLHERTNVSLKLPERSRLKLEPASELKRKHRPPISFNVELTQLELPVSYSIADLDDDDEDLPAPHELLMSARSAAKKKQESPSETTYSDSELDSLIRHVPSDLMQDIPKTAPTSTKPLKQDTNVRKLSTPLQSRKRSRRTEEILPQPKRSHFDIDSRRRSSSPAGRSDRTKVRTAFCLPWPW
jgi:hypothetical protein